MAWGCCALLPPARDRLTHRVTLYTLSLSFLPGQGQPVSSVLEVRELDWAQSGKLSGAPVCWSGRLRACAESGLHRSERREAAECSCRPRALIRFQT